ncbi:cytochrome P450 [Xylaria sp. FL0933]|nr:cytochrome P450 [Xylaria sp. FL0933]
MRLFFVCASQCTYLVQTTFLYRLFLYGLLSQLQANSNKRRLCCLSGLKMGLSVTLALCFGLTMGLFLSKALYNLFIHPLASFPGPRLWAASRLPYTNCLWRGRLHERIKDLHDTYGPVIRIAPDELSFNTAEAWNDIYCGGVGNKGFVKHVAYRNAQTFESLFDASNDNHSRLRRLLKNDFFSLAAARRQERHVQAYADRLIAQLRAHHSGKNFDDSHPADMREWYNFATFDIIGQVVLSEDFGCIDGRAYHPWTSMVLTHFKLSALLMCSRFYFSLPLLTLLAPRRLIRLRDSFLSLIRHKITRRCERALPPGERDFVTAALCQTAGTEELREQLTEDAEYDQNHNSINQPPILSRAELEANCILLLLAGSDTIATSLISVTHLLCEHPSSLRKLAAEVRSAAPLESDVHYNNITSNMPYLNAVLRETHRLCPPLANGPARVVGHQTAIIAGVLVPPNTSVGVTYYAANRSAHNFAYPDEFHPERWLSPELAARYNDEIETSGRPHDIFATDVREAVRPFSVGGRDCLGQNFAWVEFRVLLARMIWNFDMKVYRETNNKTGSQQRATFSSYARWTDQKAYMLWEKENYYVLLKERE